MNGLYRKKTKKVSKIVKDYNFGYVKRKDYVYFITIVIFLFFLSLLFSQLIKNIIF